MNVSYILLTMHMLLTPGSVRPLNFFDRYIIPYRDAGMALRTSPNTLATIVHTL